MKKLYLDKFRDKNKTKGMEVLIDSSGSVIIRRPDFYKTMIEKLKPLVGTTPLRVGLFNHKFLGFHEINKVEDLDFINNYEFGGSDLDVAVESFTKDKEIDKLLFTDGPDFFQTKHNVDVTYVVFDWDTFKGTTNSKVLVMDYKEFTKAPAQIEPAPTDEDSSDNDDEYCNE